MEECRRDSSKLEEMDSKSRMEGEPVEWLDMTGEG